MQKAPISLPTTKTPVNVSTTTTTTSMTTSVTKTVLNGVTIVREDSFNSTVTVYGSPSSNSTELIALQQMHQEHMKEGSTQPITGSDSHTILGLFDCDSEFWTKLFAEHPTPEYLMTSYMASYEDFLFTGMYMFCTDITKGKHEFLTFYFDPGNAIGESEKC